jgi:F-type H+-transporting ATPase subunit gamma
MPTLQDLKIRIKSVKSTQKITSAMKLVSASKLRKAKDKISSYRSYGERLNEIASRVFIDAQKIGINSEEFSLLKGFPESKKHLFVIVSSDRGLCGGLNSSIAKEVKRKIDNLNQDEDYALICLGKKSYEQLVGKFKEKILLKELEIFKSTPAFEDVNDISKKIMNIFQNGKFSTCSIFFNKFKSAILQQISQGQIIPFQTKEAFTEGEIQYEQHHSNILQSITPQNITAQIFSAILDNNASEHGARMAAMESASTNAKKMIKNLTLSYNRARQSNITRELIDIVSGANASG